MIVDELVREFQSRQLYQRAHVASFFPDVLYALRSRDPKIITAFLVHPSATTETPTAVSEPGPRYELVPNNPSATRL